MYVQSGVLTCTPPILYCPLGTNPSSPNQGCLTVDKMDHQAMSSLGSALCPLSCPVFYLVIWPPLVGTPSISSAGVRQSCEQQGFSQNNHAFGSLGLLSQDSAGTSPCLWVSGFRFSHLRLLLVQPPRDIYPSLIPGTLNFPEISSISSVQAQFSLSRCLSGVLIQSYQECL